MAQKWPQKNDPEMVLKWSKHGHKMTQKWSKNDPKMDK